MTPPLLTMSGRVGDVDIIVGERPVSSRRVRTTFWWHQDETGCDWRS